MASCRVMHAELVSALQAYRAARGFDADAWIEGKCAKLNAYMASCGLTACVTNVSGGVDSAVVLALCARAMRSAGSVVRHNVGVCQPIHSSDWALERGRENIAACGATAVVIDQSELHTQLATLVETATGLTGSPFVRGQLRSYMRTPTAYYVAQLYSAAGSPALVMGTGNKDEDGYLGYYCKAGDGVVDVQLIADLHKSEVFAVAERLRVPPRTRHAAPSADLWSGQTDEEELGVPYDFVELYTGWYTCLDAAAQAHFVNTLGAEARAQFAQYAATCEAVHRRNAHKLHGPIVL